MAATSAIVYMTRDDNEVQFINDDAKGDELLLRLLREGWTLHATAPVDKVTWEQTKDRTLRVGRMLDRLRESDADLD